MQENGDTATRFFLKYQKFLRNRQPLESLKFEAKVRICVCGLQVLQDPQNTEDV